MTAAALSVQWPLLSLHHTRLLTSAKCNLPTFFSFFPTTRYYEDKINNLNSTVTDLRDDLDLEREVGARRDHETLALEAERQRIENEQADAAAHAAAEHHEAMRIHAAMGRPFIGHPMHPPAVVPQGLARGPIPAPLPVPVPVPAPSYAAANRAMQTLEARVQGEQLAALQVAQTAEAQNMLADLHRVEAENRQLREEMMRSEVDMEDMQKKVLHTITLQQSFEALRVQMKETKGRMQDELEKKHLEVIRKDEEIMQLRARSQVIVQSAADVKAATSNAVKEVKRSAAVDLAAANAAVASLKAANKQQKKAYKAQIKEQKHQLSRVEASLQTMGAELLTKEATIQELKGQRKSQVHAALTAQISANNADPSDMLAGFSVLPENHHSSPEGSLAGDFYIDEVVPDQQQSRQATPVPSPEAISAAAIDAFSGGLGRPPSPEEVVAAVVAPATTAAEPKKAGGLSALARFKKAGNAVRMANEFAAGGERVRRRRQSMVIATEESVKRNQANMKRANDDLEATQKECERLNQNIARQNEEIQSMAQKVKGLEGDVMTLNQELSSVKTERDMITKEKERIESTSASQIQGLNAELKEAEEEQQARAKEIESLSEQLNEKVAELTEASAQMEKMQSSIEQAANAQGANADEIEKQKKQLKEAADAAAQKEILVQSLEANAVLLKTEIEEQQISAVPVEERARDQIQRLEVELHKAAEMTESIECLRREEKRTAETRIWDLKEQLDYSNTSRRSLQNYVGYVKDAYRDVFERPGGI